MNNEEILSRANAVQEEIEQETNGYLPLALGIAYHPDSIKLLEEVTLFYEQKTMLLMKLLPGSSEVGRKIYIEFIECAGIEQEAAKKVLVMLRDSKP